MAVNFLDGFMSNMRGKGFARANRYLVLIQPNQQVASQLGYKSEEIKQRLAMTCSSASLPSKSFMTHDIIITQPPRLVPYAINSNNTSGASFEFYVLGDMFEKNVFEMWQNLIIDPITKQQSYYNDYAVGSSIVIAELPNIVPSLDAALNAIAEQNLVSGIRLTEIYPYNFTVNGGTQNYGQAQEPLKVKVDFMYREVTRITEPKITNIDDGMRMVDENGNFTSQNVADTAAAIRESLKDFEESQRRESESGLEKALAAKEYNQSQNVPRGVDGRILYAKPDGLPAHNPNDEISQLLRQGLSFVSQGIGFLGF